MGLRKLQPIPPSGAIVMDLSDALRFRYDRIKTWKQNLSRAIAERDSEETLYYRRQLAEEAKEYNTLIERSKRNVA